MGTISCQLQNHAVILLQQIQKEYVYTLLYIYYYEIINRFFSP